MRREMRKKASWDAEAPTERMKGRRKKSGASLWEKKPYDDAAELEEMTREDRALAAYFIYKWHGYAKMDNAERYREKLREKEADDVVDQLAQYVDRIAIYGEANKGFTRRQRERLDNAIAEMRDVIKEPMRPTARGLRWQGVAEPQVRAASAWLKGESLELEEMLDGLETEEVTMIEDRAGWMLESRREERRGKLTNRQLQLMLRVEKRYAKQAERRQLLQMPVEAAEVMGGFPQFERGEAMVGGRGELRHEFSSREHVMALNERGARDQGYVCHETAKMVKYITDTGEVVGKRKTNVERVGRPIRTTVERIRELYEMNA